MVRTLVIRDVDERANYHKDQNYPHLIFLSTVLRWAVKGSAIGDQDAELIIKDNDKALASIAAFLADKIEDKIILIYHVSTKVQLGTAEMNPMLLRLQSMDGSGNVQGLADKDGMYYYLGGKELYTVIVESSPKTNNIFHYGELWHRLFNDAPAEWRTAQTTNKLGPVEVMPVMRAEESKPWEIVDPRDPAPKYPWYTPARHFARQLVIEDSTLLCKPHILTDKVVKLLAKVDIYKRGGKKPFGASTIQKAFSNVTLG